MPTTYAYCSPPGVIEFTGKNSILDRSVVLHKSSMDNPNADESVYEADSMACGTITTEIFNPKKNLIPFNAKDSDGNTCSDLDDWAANNN